LRKTLSSLRYSMKGFKFGINSTLEMNKLNL